MFCSFFANDYYDCWCGYITWVIAFIHFINNKIIYDSNNFSCASLLPHYYNFISVHRCWLYKWPRNWNISLVFISYLEFLECKGNMKHFLYYLALLDPLFSVFKLFPRCEAQSHMIKFKVNFVFHSLFCRPSPYKLWCYMKPRPIICTRGWLRFNLFTINKFTC